MSKLVRTFTSQDPLAMKYILGLFLSSQPSPASDSYLTISSSGIVNLISILEINKATAFNTMLSLVMLANYFFLEALVV